MSLLSYFDPREEPNQEEKKKAIALKWILISVFFLLLILIIQTLYTQSYISLSDYFLPVGLVFVISSLFVLRNYGSRKAGGFFSIGSVIIMTIVINIFDQDTIFTKYGEEFYLAIFALVFISLFSSRKILIVAAVLFFLSSLGVSFYLQNTFVEQTDILREVQLFFSFTIINITLILYFATKFSDSALERVREDAKIKDEQNKALEREREKSIENELLYRNIVNNLIGGFYKTDVAGLITLASPSFLRITGYDLDTVLGTPISSILISPNLNEDVFNLAIEQNQLKLYKAEVITADKGKIVVETNARTVTDSKGKISGVEGIFYDISERIKLETELENNRKHLEDTNNTLAKAVQELDRFVYSASHDLGAPLKSILGLVNLAKMENENENLGLYLNYIEESILKQEDVITSLIQYSKNSRIEIDKEPIDLYDFIGQIVDELKYMPGFGEVTLNNNLPKGTIVESDSLRLKMILSNLISNSVKYRNNGVEECFVQLDFESQDHYWFLSIEDNGQGISEEYHDKIFNMFYRANKGSEGSGLGLFIVQEAVQVLGGTITLSSSENKGSKFKLRFPS